MTTASQAATAAILAMLNAPTPWHPRDENARVLMDGLGRPRFLILPVDDSDAATDAALARAVGRLINKEAGAESEAAEHVEPRPAQPVFGQRVGGVAGA